MIHPLRAVSAYRRLKRYREVTFTLVKHGFDDVVDRLGFRARGWGRLRKGKRSRRDIPTPERLRMVLTELGPTFVKFGQLLSTRPDILPERYVTELERLQDDVAPFSITDVRRIVREELKEGETELFADFQTRPVASGSIAQVHRATLPTGEEVAVKIQRPAIQRVIETDLDILNEITSLVERHIPEMRWLRPQNLVQQFAGTIRRELDFIAEAQAMERFRRNFEGDPICLVPRVHWKYTSARVLTADHIEGIKITDLKALEEGGFDRKAIARNGARTIFKEVFEHRLFHADPHPGNFFVLEGNAIAAVDFGIVGRLDNQTTDDLGQLLTAVVQRDVNGITRVFKEMGILDEGVDLNLLKFDIQDYIDRYYGLPLDKIDAEKLIQDLLGTIRRHHIILPMNLALLGRMLAVSAGVGRTLDPDFDLIAEAKPFVQSFLARRMDPRRKVAALMEVLQDYQEALRSLPSDLEEILAKVKKGQMLVSLHHEGLNRFILEMDRSSNRLAFALIIASLIVGSSFVMQMERGPSLFGFSALGLAGYLIAGLLGLWLVVAILRSGRI